MRSFSTVLHEANTSAKETYDGCHWIFTKLVSRYARKQASLALICLLVSILCLMAIPLTLKYIIDAYAQEDQTAAIYYLGFTTVCAVVATIFGTLHDHFREKAWNRNYFTINIRLMRMLFSRTLDEILGENSEIGAEQIESTKDRAQNILYLLLFESPVVLATILSATIFIWFIDPVVGMCAICLTIFNLLWFFFFNTTIDAKMEIIDRDFRRAGRRLIEKLNLVLSAKAGGVEDKLVDETAAEIKGPLLADLKIWAYWFQYVDFTRRLVNALVPPATLLYGIVYSDWSTGSLAAISSWMFMISREYGFIGHLMRHLTSQVARVKAARQTLSTQSLFSYDKGLVYERSTK